MHDYLMCQRVISGYYTLSITPSLPEDRKVSLLSNDNCSITANG